MIAKPIPVLAEIQKAADIIIGKGRGRVVEVRAPGTPEQTYSGYYNNGVLANDVYDLSSKETTPNVYWTIQDIKPELLKPGRENLLFPFVSETTSDEEVNGYFWLPIDCDPIRKAGISSTDDEKAEAEELAYDIRRFLNRLGITSILADSGNGYHVLVRLDIPNQNGTSALVEKTLKALNARFGKQAVHVDTSIYNPSRILKVYGSAVRKGPHTDERPWRLSQLVDVPELTILSEENLKNLLSEIVKDLPAEKAAELNEPKKRYEPPAPGTQISEERNNAVCAYAWHVWNKQTCELPDVEDLKSKVYQFNSEFCTPPLDKEELDRTVLSSTPKKKRARDTGVFSSKPNPQPPTPEQSKWEDPVKFNNSLLPVKTFRLEFLPRSLQGWAKDVAERTNVPLDFVGICSLVTLAGVTNRRAFVFPKQHDKEWKEALALSGAVVAPSGKLKTPTWKAFTNILVEREYDWREEYAKAKAKFDTDSKNWETAQKNNEKNRKSGEGVIVETPPPVEPLQARRLIVNDTTPEMMHTIMSANPEGIMVYRDELSSWVAELDKEGREVQRGLSLAAMNGNDPYTVDRIGRGSVTAIMSASLFGGFQPDLLVEFLNDTRNISDGMMPRFGLIVWPDAIEGHRVDRAADDVSKEQFRRIIRTLAEMKADSIGLHFDGPAQARFNTWYDQLDREVSKEPHPGKQSHLSKYRGLLPKLAALLQLADLVDTLGVAAKGGRVVDINHLEQAIELLAYLESHMNRVYGCIRSAEQKAEESLAKHLEAGDLENGFNIREIQRKHWSDLGDIDAVKFALETMEEMAWIRELPVEKRRGKPTTRWEINPAIRRD